ncbi:MAG TPA: CHASE3 domain-containing protein, partial [Polyangiaceae bacterium]|nr:CHASE3 domain-containing protein [Polyangiaceae bacterium]
MAETERLRSPAVTQRSKSGPLAERGFLARRLTAAMLTPLALLLLLGLVLGRQILEMADDAQWVDHSDRVVSAANRTLLEVLNQETALRGFLLVEDPSMLEPFRRANPLGGFDELKALTADNPAQERRFAEARRRYEDWSVAATMKDPSAELRGMREPRVLLQRKAKMDAFRDAMRSALDVEIGLRKTRAETSQRSTEMTKQLFVLLVGASAAVLAFLSRRQLSSIASTFADALAAEKKARDAVESEAWVRSGHAKLTATLQGEKTIVELGEACLAVLTKLTSADVGAFFTRDHGHWRRRAGYALDSRAAGQELFPLGEGLVGRAAQSGELLDLRDVPAGYLEVRSGTGASRPLELFVVPAQSDGETVAVLELAYLREATPEARALLSRIGETLATAVRSSEYKQHLRELLEETQRQAEELQTQQEELRVSNEELEQQSQA